MSVDAGYCPLCGSTQSSLFDQRDFRGHRVTNRLCTNCGLVYQSPRMSDKELLAFYEEGYRQLYQGSAEPGGRDLAVQRMRAESLLSFAQDRITTISHHLDIGCSAGILLERFRRAYGCQPVGVEPGEAYRKYAHRQGLTVFATLEELKAVIESKFDLVSMAHVLEHLPDPVEYLSQLKENLLAADGWLLVEVPNLYAHDCFEVAHLVSYSSHTLTQTLESAGYEVSFITQSGQPRSRIIPLYLTVLARPVQALQKHPGQRKPDIIPEKAVRQKRKWGMFHRRLVTRLLPRQAWLPLQKP